MNSEKWRKLLPLLALFSANFISLTGSALTSIAIPWFVLQTTGSVVKTGVSAFFTIVPTIIANVLGGVLVDRIGYKWISVMGDLTAGIGILLIPLFYDTVGLPFVGLLVLIFLAMLLSGPGNTARLSMMPDLAEKANMPYERATSISQGIGHISVLVGAPMAGILIALIGTNNLLWIDALSFFLSAAIISIGIPALRKASVEKGQVQESQPQPAQPAKAGFLADLQAGLGFIFKDKLILVILLTLMITNALDASLTGVVTPYYVKQLFGNAIYLGLIDAAFVAAALLGTVIYGAVGHRLRREIMLALALILVGLRFWVLSLLPPLAIILLITAVSGIASSPLNPIVFTIAYERIPAVMRGRVLGVGMACSALGMPLGVLASGYLISGIGLQPTLLIMGGCYLLVTLGLFSNPTLYNAKAPEAAPEAAPATAQEITPEANGA